MKVLVVFYSMYGHIYKMAQAIAEGQRRLPARMSRCAGSPKRSPTRSSQDGRPGGQKAMAGIPVCKVDELAGADAIIFGTPTRFGNMCGQMRQFLDATGQLWAKMHWSARWERLHQFGHQHGGQESTILTFHITLLHQGMVVVGLPYAFTGQNRTDEITAAPPTVRRLLPAGRASACPAKTSCPPPAAGKACGPDCAKLAK